MRGLRRRDGHGFSQARGAQDRDGRLPGHLGLDDLDHRNTIACSGTALFDSGTVNVSGASPQTVESGTMTRPRTKMRTLDVVIEGYALANTNLDDTLDQISLEVEEAMVTDVTRGGKAKDTELVDVEIEQVGEGETQAGIVRMTFSVMYATVENDAETPV